MDYIEIIIFIVRILIALMLIPFIILQWRVRNRNGIIKKLRHLTIWETVSLFALFLTIASFREYAVNQGIDFPLWTQLISLAATVAVFIAFIKGTILFLEIHNGKHDNDPHVTH